MGRTIRRVPIDWVAPDSPHFDQSYDEALAAYDQDCAKAVEDGHDPVEWCGPPPDPAYYRPAWPDGATMGYQVYENVSEGSPISPVFVTRDALLDWLTQPDGAPGMGIGGRALVLSRLAAVRFVEDGYAPSMVLHVEPDGTMRAVDGVASLGDA